MSTCLYTLRQFHTAQLFAKRLGSDPSEDRICLMSRLIHRLIHTQHEIRVILDEARCAALDGGPWTTRTRAHALLDTLPDQA